MKTFREFWTSSPPEHKDYLFIYAWGALWALVYLIFPPSATVSAFSTSMVWLWTITTILGGILGIWGLVPGTTLSWNVSVFYFLWRGLWPLPSLSLVYSS